MRNKVISFILATGALTALSFGVRQAFAYDGSAAVDYTQYFYKKISTNGWYMIGHAASNHKIGRISGNVTDSVTGLRLPDVRIDLEARITDIVPDGSFSLRGLDETVPLGIYTTTDDRGQFLLEIALEKYPIFLKIIFSKEGYKTSFDALVKAEADQTNMVNFELFPLILTPEELEILRHNHEKKKQKLYQENPSFIQELNMWEPEKVLQESPFEGTYPVPEQVYVCNLQDFTGWMELDEFVWGVVSAEMGDSFPVEALKAQAVAARSYSLEKYERTGCANGGQAYRSDLGNFPKSGDATVNTTKVVVLYLGSVISAYYSARCNGDATLNSEDGVWHRDYVCDVGGNYIPYARSSLCTGHTNCSSYPGESPCCYVFTGGRWVYIYGHGVGMCQRGAQAMANGGYNYHHILTHYYTGINLANPSPPTVQTRDATPDVIATAATLNATITDNSGESIDERRFDWGTTPSCSDGWTADVIVDGTSFSYLLTELEPGTTYYFRGWAHNSAGWGHGDVLNFTLPRVDDFDVIPTSITLGYSFNIPYTVSDIEGPGLSRVELWRANDSGDSPVDWTEIDRTSLSGNGPVSGSFSDGPSSTGAYWYGIHVVNNAGFWSFEPDPPGPMERTVTTDTTPPSPDPMTWLSEPYQTSTSSISMVATTASDESTPISYYFDFYSSPTGGSGGTDSDWQTSPTYSDSDLQVNHKYGYRVKARDSVGNETAYSSTSYEYTDAKVPGTASFSDVTGSSIQVNWTANGNPSWTEYFCENVTNGTNSGWTTSTHWDDTELISETEYCYQVKTRNGDGEETGWTNLGCETTLASKIPLMDLNHDGMMNLGDFAIFGFFWMNDTCCDPNWCEGSDSDQSGMVNFLDLSNFVDDWLWQYWTVIQLTDNSEFDLEHDVSGSSIVWMGGGISEDYEIFLYNGTKTSQVTNNGYDDVFPGVSGTNIAWLGQVDADGEIFLFDGTTTTRLTDNSYQEGVPRVSGSHVVWEGYDGNDDEIFLYDGTSLTQLTDNSYADEVPRVSGSNVVWCGRCDPTLRGEIFLYDGTSTTQLTNDTNFDLDPDVSGSNVVWASKDITSEYEIFLYDGTDTIQLTNNTYRDFDPHVSGYNVVWKALIGGDWEIFFYDGTTTIQLTDNSSDDEHPRVSGSIVVWHGWDGNDKEIFIYDGTSTIQLTDNNYDDEEPEVSGSTIVWRGWDGNDWEIFMAIPTDTIF